MMNTGRTHEQIARYQRPTVVGRAIQYRDEVPDGKYDWMVDAMDTDNILEVVSLPKPDGIMHLRKYVDEDDVLVRFLYAHLMNIFN